MPIASTHIDGHVAPEFAEVRSAFEDNFARRGEVGAACCIYISGQKVVDLWGGYRDSLTGARWEEDTIVPVFSTTKGVSAMALALANSRGLLDYDERVSAYWPEFASKGKGAITVRQLLAHQAGLCAIDERLTNDMLADLDAVAAAAASQGLLWETGHCHGYHTMSLGWYAGELIRRVDPRHRSMGEFIAQEMVAPLGLEFYLGLPDTVPMGRIARLESIQLRQTVKGFTPGAILLAAGFLNPWSLSHRSAVNPRLRPLEMNQRRQLAVQMPASNGVGRVSSIARLYGIFANGGGELEIEQRTLDELAAAPSHPRRGTWDVVTKMDAAFSLGFMKPNKAVRFGCDSRAYGTPGLGGSIGWADPTRRIGFAYAPNALGYTVKEDPRRRALVDAMERCLTRCG